MTTRGMRKSRICDFPGCRVFATGRGLCPRHYDYFRREVELGRASWKALQDSGYGDYEDGQKLYEYIFGATSRENAKEIAYNIVKAEKVRTGLDVPSIQPMNRNDARRFALKWADTHGSNVLIPLKNRRFAKPDPQGKHSYLLAVFGLETPHDH